jgi:hypothetical protein
VTDVALQKDSALIRLERLKELSSSDDFEPPARMGNWFRAACSSAKATLDDIFLFKSFFVLILGYFHYGGPDLLFHLSCRCCVMDEVQARSHEWLRLSCL